MEWPEYTTIHRRFRTGCGTKLPSQLCYVINFGEIANGTEKCGTMNEPLIPFSVYVWTGPEWSVRLIYDRRDLTNSTH